MRPEHQLPSTKSSVHSSRENFGTVKKLDYRSRKYYFVGYAPNGYRLWNPDKRNISTARCKI
ncbi:hypothetical protein X777_14219 [Ooceraea biroi]|uniref:Retroviral polymerase SH3-like domain-containing protein n=1 Tax=Ooceraea biroi TaxID=2015173 RepID=A0A026VWW6_OOCBI|nr:hypothetical protein X777_14219 [Ooceraea biroi]